MSTTYPIAITIDTLQTALRETHDVVWQELGRNCDLRSADDTAQAVLFEMALNGQSHVEMRARLRQSAEWTARASAAIDAIYVEELGRHADDGGLAGYIAFMRETVASIEEVRARIHASAEAVGYRDHSKVRNPLGRLHVEAVSARDPDYPLATWHPLVNEFGRIVRMVGCTNFCAIRDKVDRLLHPNGKLLWTQDMDDAVRYGFNAIDCYRALGFDGDGTQDTGYFKGRGVSPLWLPEHLPEFLHEADVRGLGIILSCGHKNVTQAERLRWERAWMEAAVAYRKAHVVKMVIGDNEAFQNADFRLSPEQLEVYRQLQAMMRDVMGDDCPLFACGAPESEGTDDVLNVATPFAQVVSVHVARDEDKMVRRTFNAVYDDNKWRVRRHWSFDEPTPIAGGPDDFMGITSFGRQVAQAGMSIAVGGTYVYFDGWDVKSTEPLTADAPTFFTMAKFLDAIPIDVVRSKRIPGGRIWWWELPDGRWMTIADELWGAGALVAPPGVTINRWQAHGPFNTVINGAGPLFDGREFNPVLRPGWGGAIFIEASA
jgi:hypothetical protein